MVGAFTYILISDQVTIYITKFGSAENWMQKNKKKLTKLYNRWVNTSEICVEYKNYFKLHGFERQFLILILLQNIFM